MKLCPMSAECSPRLRRDAEHTVGRRNDEESNDRGITTRISPGQAVGRGLKSLPKQRWPGGMRQLWIPRTQECKIGDQLRNGQSLFQQKVAFVSVL